MQQNTKLSWQDIVGLVGLVGGVLAMNAEDTLFLCIYLLLAFGAVALAIHHHSNLSKTVRLTMYALTCILAVFFFLKAYEKNAKARLALREDSFVPDALAMPLNKCMVSREDFVVFLGKGIVSVTQAGLGMTGPHTVVSIANESLLSLNKSKYAGILVSYQLFDDRGNVIATADKNRFWVSAASRQERPDLHRLKVFDHSNDLVLDLYFANISALIIKGHFRPKHISNQSILITDEYVEMLPSKNRLSGLCSEYSESDISLQLLGRE